MKVLIFGAHPDDIEINCGGTVSKLLKAGHAVTMCNLCSGSLGHAQIPPEEIAKIRDVEATNSSAVVGAKHISLGVNDLELYHQDDATRRAVANIIREENPTYIITHDPSDYMSDHVAVSKVVVDASFCASLPFYDSPCKTVVPTCPIFFMDNFGLCNFEPTEYVDVTNEWQDKMDMINCHKSQVDWLKTHDKIDFCEIVRTFSKTRGYQCGTEYAEGFKQLCAFGRMTTRRLLP